MKRLVIVLSALLNVFLIAFLAWLLVGGGSNRVVAHILALNRARLVSLWEDFPVDRTHTVFLGASLTQLGRWSEFFPKTPIKNMGIAGDTTQDLLDRLNQVTKGRPARVFLQIGTNDLTSGSSPKDLENRYSEILNRLVAESPETLIYVQSLLPRSSDYEPQVMDANQRIRRLALERGLPYIDIYSVLLCDRSICSEYSNDAIHLLGPGYVKWVELLRPYIDGA